jgi:hypothetical protein
VPIISISLGMCYCEVLCHVGRRHCCLFYCSRVLVSGGFIALGSAGGGPVMVCSV